MYISLLRYIDQSIRVYMCIVQFLKRESASGDTNSRLAETASSSPDAYGFLRGSLIRSRISTRDLHARNSTYNYIDRYPASLVHVPNDSLPEIRTSPSGLANPTAGHGAHGRNPGNYPRTHRSGGTSESRELQLPQLSTSLFLIRILIKFNTHGNRARALATAAATEHKEERQRTRRL